MSAAIKAVVFKTAKFKATKAFFETELGLPVKEFSNQHFVVFSKGIRLVFLECTDDFEVDFYVNGKPDTASLKNDKMQPLKLAASFTSHRDPNGIIITVFENDKPDKTNIK